MDDLERDLPWPQLSDSLFIYGDDWWNNACLNFLPRNWALYAMGYKEGANALVKLVQQEERHQDVLVYPIVFLYRHYIELVLKEIIVVGGRLHDNEKPSPKHHRIEELWREARGLLSVTWPDDSKEELDAVERCIREFAQYDPVSMSFRYPVDKKGNPTLPRDLQHINLRNLGNVMDGLSVFFEGVLGGLSEYLDYKTEYESEYRDRL